MRDYYEVLGITPDATTDQIRRAYKMAALRCHPDKNHGRVAEAEAEFKEVTQAYGVLVDDKERAWYDAHKDAILRGDSDGTTQPDELNLYPFFSPKCYKGFGDDPNGFFTVFRKVFDTLLEEEQKDFDIQQREAQANSGSSESPKRVVLSAPSFGKSDSAPFEEAVLPFYRFWTSFSTKKSFAWKDEYKVHDMPDRRNRRAAEQYNMKERMKAKKEFSSLVQELVAHVRRLDPRVEAEEARQAELNAIKEEERAKKLAEGMKKRREADRKLMEEVAKEEEAREMDAQKREEAMENVFGDGVDEQFEKHRQAEEERLAKERDEEYKLMNEVHTCEVCDGATFKGQTAWKAHQNSKKHKANLRVEKRTAPTAEAKGPNGDEEEKTPSPAAASAPTKPTKGTTAQTPASQPTQKKAVPEKESKPKPTAKPEAHGSEDGALPPTAQAKGKAKGKGKGKQGPIQQLPKPASESDDEDEESDDEPQASRPSFGGFAALNKRKR